MDGGSSLNPYAPTNVPAMPYSADGRPVRSGWLVTICVIATVLGALGAMNGVTGMVALAYQKQLQGAFTPPAQPGMPPEVQQAQQEFQKQVQELQGNYAVLLVAAAVGRVAVGLALAVGGIWCLQQKLSGRSFLIGALAAVLCFEVASGILQGAMTLQTMELMGEFMKKMVDAMPNRNGPPPDFIMAMMRGALWAGFALGLLWQAVKIGFYVGAFLYLRRPTVANQFQPAAAATTA